MSVKPPKEAPGLLLSAADAAVTWWKSKRPVGWTIAQHVIDPTINTAGYREKRLARAAARWYAIQHPQHSGDAK